MTVGTRFMWALCGVNLVLLVALLWGLDRNRVVWGQRLRREGRV